MSNYALVTYQEFCDNKYNGLITYLINKGIYFDNLRIDSKLNFPNYIPDKKMIIKLYPIHWNLERFISEKDYYVFDPKGFNYKEIYSKIMEYGNQKANNKFKFRQLLLKSNIDFRYNRKIDTVGSVDFYFKDYGNLCIDLVSHHSDLQKSTRLVGKGYNYKSFPSWEYKNILKNLGLTSKRLML